MLKYPQAKADVGTSRHPPWRSLIVFATLLVVNGNKAIEAQCGRNSPLQSGVTIFLSPDKMVQVVTGQIFEDPSGQNPITLCRSNRTLEEIVATSTTAPLKWKWCEVPAWLTPPMLPQPD